MTDTEATIFTLQAMLKQEEACYHVSDIFQNLPEKTSRAEPVDAAARMAIAKWVINIMDACHYQREIAAVTMSCLDRFLSTSDGYSVLLNRSEYQLAALSAVYTSVKIHCPQALSPDLVARLSQGSFSRQDIERMERRILNSIQWRVNPPTALSFLRSYLDLIPSHSLDEQSRKVIVDLVALQTDLSVTEYKFATEKASHVALGSLMNAMECIFANDLDFCDDVAELISVCINVDPNKVHDLRNSLYEAIDQTSVPLVETKPKIVPHSSHSKRMHRDTFYESPRSVYEHHAHHQQQKVMEL
jgi:hypothetical protein